MQQPRLIGVLCCLVGAVVAPCRAGTVIGTGFAVSAEGYIVTCHHLVADAATIEVAIGGGAYAGTVVAVDKDHDLALLKIRAAGLVPLALADLDKVVVGASVCAIGFPLGSRPGASLTVTRGPISGITTVDGQKVLQVDAGADPGNCGGPLVNEFGEVVGVVNVKPAKTLIADITAAPIQYTKMLLAANRVEFGVGRTKGKLDGPALVKRVSPAVAFIAVTTRAVPATAVEAGGMVSIPAGPFTMGSPPGPGDADERPAHKVTLSAYLIDVTEVTNEEYGKLLEYVKRTGDHSKCFKGEPPGYDHTPKYWTDPNWNRPRQPVGGVSWFDAYAYAAWAGKRLPTEAEWERAARGTDGYRFPWGNEWDPSKCNAAAGGKSAKTDVGSYPEGKSPYGCLDMAGNVWEWCADWYGDGYYQSSPPENPTGPEIGAQRVLRGGSCADSSLECHTTYRFKYFPGSKLLNNGFRCARTP